MTQGPRTVQERAVELLRATLAPPSWLPDTEAKRLVWAIRAAIVLALIGIIASVVDKTLWAWLELLIVPAVIAAGGLWFNRQQQERQRKDGLQQQERELEIANQRAQDDALQAYLDQIGQLMLENDLGDSEQGAGVRTLARARTLTLLARVGPARKGSVIQFLYEANLINKGSSVVNLRGADLVGAILSQLDLSHADLSGTILNGANFNAAILVETDLSEAWLRKAELMLTDMMKTDLSGTDLTEANLWQAQLSEEQLAQAWSLKGVTLPNGQKYEDWQKYDEWLKSQGSAEEGENE